MGSLTQKFGIGKDVLAAVTSELNGGLTCINRPTTLFDRGRGTVHCWSDRGVSIWSVGIDSTLLYTPVMRTPHKVNLEVRRQHPA